MDLRDYSSPPSGCEDSGRFVGQQEVIPFGSFLFPVNQAFARISI